MHNKYSQINHLRKTHSLHTSVGKGVCVCVLEHTCVKCHIRVGSEETHDVERLMLYTNKLQATQKSTYTTLVQKLVKNLAYNTSKNQMKHNSA